MLWSGTVAENLDPTKQLSEKRLLEALSKAALGIYWGVLGCYSVVLLGLCGRVGAEMPRHLGFIQISACVNYLFFFHGLSTACLSLPS